MKILFISNLFPNCQAPSHGIFNLHQIRHLAQLCSVRVIAPIPWLPMKDCFGPHAPIPVFEEIPLGKEPRSRMGPQPAANRSQPAPVASLNSQVLPVDHPRQYYLPKIGRALNPWLYALSLRKVVTRLRVDYPFDVIFVNWAFPDACGMAQIARRLRVPFIVSISGSDANVGLTYRIRRRQILRMLAQASAVTVRSQALRDLLISHGATPGKIHVLYNGVDRVIPTAVSRDEARQRLGFAKEERVLVYVGRLSPEKGVADLLEALAILRDRDRLPVRLLVVGAGRQGSELRQLAAARGLSSAVVWAGQKPPAAVSGDLIAADVLCLASHMEGVPNVALEAFACGVPVVGTRVGGIPEVLTEEVGLLANPKDPADLARALHAAFHRPWAADRIRAHAGKFDWNANARQLQVLLQSVVDAAA